MSAWPPELSMMRAMGRVALDVLEEHPVHCGVGLVVLVARAVELDAKAGQVGDAVVDLVAHTLRKVVVAERLGDDRRRRYLHEELVRLLHRELLALF